MDGFNLAMKISCGSILRYRKPLLGPNHQRAAVRRRFGASSSSLKCGRTAIGARQGISPFLGHIDNYCIIFVEFVDYCSSTLHGTYSVYSTYHAFFTPAVPSRG